MENHLKSAQYKSYSDHRLHFSRLYFGTVAFVLIFAFALFFLSILIGSGGNLSGYMLAAVGIFIVFGGFIANKLMLREIEYASLLAQIEKDNDLLTTSDTKRIGARSLVVWALYLSGIATLILAGYILFSVDH